MYIVFLLLSTIIWMAVIFLSPFIMMAVGTAVEIYCQDKKLSSAKELTIRIICMFTTIILIVTPIIITITWR